MADQPEGNVETPPVVTPVAPPAAEVEAGVPSQTDVNTPKQVPLAALQEERDRNRELRAQIEALNRVVGSISGIPTEMPTGEPNGANPTQPTPTQEYAQDLPPQGPQMSKEDLDRMWQDDPRKAMQTEMGMALNWYDRVGAVVDNQEGQLSRKVKDFDLYRDQVRSYIRALPPEHRIKPGVVEMAYYVVRGQSFDKTVQAREAEILRRVRAGESAQGYGAGPVSSQPAKSPDQLSAAEAAIALNMGMTPEEYSAHKKS